MVDKLKELEQQRGEVMDIMGALIQHYSTLQGVTNKAQQENMYTKMMDGLHRLGEELDEIGKQPSSVKEAVNSMVKH